ncbi:MAG: hypothetical protein ACREXW_01115 [Gammaproteobacteria bacterium]
MTTVTFDTLRFVETFKAAGVSDAQAKAAVARRLAKAMKAAGIRNTELAERCDVTVQAVGGWLRTGRIAPRHFPDICMLVECTIEWLTTGKELSAEARAAAMDLDADTLRLARAIQSLAPRDRAHLKEDPAAYTADALHLLQEINSLPRESRVVVQQLVRLLNAPPGTGS